MAVPAIGRCTGSLDMTGITLDTTTAGAAAGIVVAGLAVLWGIRKAISFFGK
jgi:hypothetical protein